MFDLWQDGFLPRDFHGTVKLFKFSSASSSFPSHQRLKIPHAQSWKTGKTNGFKNNVFKFVSKKLEKLCNLWLYTTLSGVHFPLFPSEITPTVKEVFYLHYLTLSRDTEHCACPTIPIGAVTDFEKALTTDCLVTPRGVWLCKVSMWKKGKEGDDTLQQRWQSKN